MTMAVFRGRVVPENSKGLHHEYDPIFRHHFYSNFHMDDQNMRRYLDHVRSIGPCFLHVYPSSVANLARFLFRSGIEPPQNVLGIIAESENVYPEQRQMVEKVFGRRYFSSYGHTEKLVAAAECEKLTNYHVWPTYGYFELLDENGHPITTPGQRGEIVGTGFINTVVPFIRYRTGDYATYIGESCNECGRAHPIIADIRGHNIQENLVACDGSLIAWSAVNVHDDTFENVLQFQFYQDTPGRALLRIVPTPGFGEKDQQRIRQNLGRKFDNRLEFEICMTDSISLSKSGKAIYVDQQIQSGDQTF
jgi:phenylacetate-CoA ligase